MVVTTPPMSIWFKIIIILTFIFFIFGIVWAFHIIPKQLTFIEMCEDKCMEYDLNYDVTFNSLPWNNLNGRCNCLKEIDALEVSNEQ